MDELELKEKMLEKLIDELAMIPELEGKGEAEEGEPCPMCQGEGCEKCKPKGAGAGAMMMMGNEGEEA